MAESTLDLVHVIGRESLTLLWGPLLLWTVAAALVLGGLHLWRGGHPLVHYRVRQALLFALPMGMLAAFIADPITALTSSGWSADGAAPSTGLIVVPDGALGAAEAGWSGAGPSWSLMHGLGVATVLAASVVLVQVGRLGWQARALRHLPEQLCATECADAEATAEELARALGITRPVRLLVTPQSTAPLTFGARHPTIIVPEAVTRSEEDLRLTLLHELTHIRRRDYLWGWAERLIAALFAIHPGVGWLRRQIDRHREMACDAAVLRETPDRRSYANLLYRLTELSLPPRAAAVPLADSSSSLKERIQAMTRLNHIRDNPTVLALATAAFVLLLGGSIVACSDALEVDEEATDEQIEASEAPIDDDEVVEMAEDMPELIGGMEALINEIEYPEFAREQDIEGTVFVEFIVGPAGQVHDATVSQGVHVELDEEARRAVGEMEFEPGMQDGDPVPVEMAIPVQFQLSDDG